MFLSGLALGNIKKPAERTGYLTAGAIQRRCRRENIERSSVRAPEAELEVHSLASKIGRNPRAGLGGIFGKAERRHRRANQLFDASSQKLRHARIGEESFGVPGKLKMKFSPMSPAGVQQAGGASFDIRCSAIAKEPKTVRE